MVRTQASGPAGRGAGTGGRRLSPAITGHRSPTWTPAERLEVGTGLRPPAGKAGVSCICPMPGNLGSERFNPKRAGRSDARADRPLRVTGTLSGPESRHPAQGPSETQVREALPAFCRSDTPGSSPHATPTTWDTTRDLCHIVTIHPKPGSEPLVRTWTRCRPVRSGHPLLRSRITTYPRHPCQMDPCHGTMPDMTRFIPLDLAFGNPREAPDRRRGEVGPRRPPLRPPAAPGTGESASTSSGNSTTTPRTCAVRPNPVVVFPSVPFSTG